MSYDSLTSLPILVEVIELVSSRYKDNTKPLSWDKRVQGNDVVVTEDNKKLNLLSDGGQSPPQSGWTILVTGGNPTEGYHWTLYSLPKKVAN